MNLFLEHCSWGNGRSERKTDWSLGHSLIDMKRDSTLQEKALHDILFGNFRLKFFRSTNDGSGELLAVSMEFPSGHTPPTMMKVSLAMVGYAGERASRIRLPEGAERSLSRGEAVLGLMDLPQPPAGYGDIQISSKVSLDIYGDGRIVICRTLDGRASVTQGMLQ